MTDDGIEAKGLWFASTHAYLRRVGGASMLEDVAGRMPRHGDVLREPLNGAWYPEAALHEMLEALWHLVDGDEARYLEHTMAATGEGVGKFFRILIALGSPGFVLRKVPVMWGRLRRGDQTEIEVTAGDGHADVHYTRFPYFRHEVYRLMTVASLRGLVHMSTSRLPETELLEASHDAVKVRVRFD